jgi:hypothetical protein
MTPRLINAPWSDLCAEERERVLDLLAEAGGTAAREMAAAGTMGGWTDVGAAFRAYRQAIAVAERGAGPRQHRTWTHEDLRAAAFCVAFEDERRRLLGLRPVPRTLTWLAQAARQAARCYSAALIISECEASVDETRERRLARIGRLPGPPARVAAEACRQAGDRLTLALMRLNLAAGGQGTALRHILR